MVFPLQRIIEHMVIVYNSSKAIALRRIPNVYNVGSIIAFGAIENITKEINQEALEQISVEYL